MDKISVIVPIYNSEKYLKFCIDSILNQNYKNFEILLINDGSTDNSLNICYEYSQKNNNIRVFNLKHGGVSVARNFGISQANGQYICFIDSDDIIKNNFLKTLIDMILKFKLDIAEVDFEYINKKIKLKNEKIDFVTSEEMIERLYSKEGIRTVHITNKLFNINLFNNIKFENKENEDEYIIHKLLFETKKKIAINNQKLYLYRTLDNGRERKFNSEKLRKLEVFDERDKFFINNTNLVKKNKLAKLDMILYLSYICDKNKKREEKKWLANYFLEEYQKLNVKPDLKRRIKYYLFMKKPKLIIKIIELRNRKRYG